MIKTQQILITLPAEQMQRLREIAHYHGYILDRSQRKGQGNISQMLRALAEGQLVLYPTISKEKVK